MLCFLIYLFNARIASNTTAQDFGAVCFEKKKLLLKALLASWLLGAWLGLLECFYSSIPPFAKLDWLVDWLVDSNIHVSSQFYYWIEVWGSYVILRY